jgi:hypothetical protein
MTAWPHLGVFHARTEACRYHYVQADGQFGLTIQESVCFGLDRFAGGDGEPKTSITKNYVWNGWLTSGRPTGSRSTAATQQPKLALGSVPKVDSPQEQSTMRVKLCSQAPACSTPPPSVSALALHASLNPSVRPHPLPHTAMVPSTSGCNRMISA